MILETPRLLLRNLTKNDVEDVFEYSRTPNVGPCAGWRPHESREETLGILHSIFIGQPSIFGIVWKETGRVIGSVGLIQDGKRENPAVKMLGYALGEAYWGKGIMTEAARAVVEYGFQTLDLDGISVSCYTTNDRSRRVIEKLGFEREGILHSGERRYDGQIFDVECWFRRK